MSPDKYFTEKQKSDMVAAIQDAEKDTSGEIRIHIENHSRKAPLDRAAQVFAELEMHKTALRNGVLIYVALKDHTLAIIGDIGINQKVPSDFWNNVKEQLVHSFKEGKVSEGLSEAVRTVGKQLKTLFPYQSDDVNELSDDISFGKDK